MTRRARVFGRLIVTTCPQLAEVAPLLDGANVRDAEGRRYGAVVLGRGRRALVIGWRDAPVPPWWLLRRIRAPFARPGLRIRAAAHEVRCAECRVTWSSWAGRLTGLGGMGAPTRLYGARTVEGGADR